MSTIVTIASGDLISNSRADINTSLANLNADKFETSDIDTDTTLAANSDTKVASEKAIKTYVDAATGNSIGAGIFTKDLTTTTSTTIAHGLASAPRIVRITGMLATGTNPLTQSLAYTIYVSSTQYSTSQTTVDNVASAG